jgi:hypothetical protein
MIRLLIILAAVAIVVELNDAKPLDQAAIALGVAACLAYLWSRLSVRKMTLVREPLVDHVAVGETFVEQLTLINGALDGTQRVQSAWRIRSRPGTGAIGRSLRVVRALGRGAGDHSGAGLAGVGLSPALSGTGRGLLGWAAAGLEPVYLTEHFRDS